MKVCLRRFNIYLAVVVAFALLAGCRTDRRDKDVAALRVHIEVSPDPAGTSQTVSLPRSTPVLVTVKREPILTEANIVAAKIIEAPGGPAIEVKFDETSAWILGNYSAANPGRHFVIFGEWGRKPVNSRWLAALIITHRFTGGLLAFTPDASREEAGQIVLGLNNVARENRKALLK